MAASDSIPILIYTRHLGPRLRYILDYIFGYRLGIRYEVTDLIDQVKQSSAFTINYSDISFEAGLTIIPHSILSTQGIGNVELSLNRWKKTFIIFYNQPGAKIPFDIFSAVFFFISRYEEYLPFTPDRHGRFPAALSLAGKYAFLQQPVVDLWLLHFRELLPFPVNTHRADWEATMDVDMIWKYLNKKPSVQRWGIIKDILKLNLKGLRERQQVLKQQIPDPFDCFDEIRSCIGKEVRYFILTSLGLTRFDRNTAPDHPGFQKKIRILSNGTNMGIHPSYYAVIRKSVGNEINALSEVLGDDIYHSRQHFIRLSLPETYRQLLEAGIREDFTMGYPEVNGFRAGTSLPFYWYDLSKEEPTQLFIHPFVYMDATQLFYGRQEQREQLAEMERIAYQVKSSHGRFIGIWHNYILGDQLTYPQQLDLLKKSVALLNQIFPPED